MLTRLIAFAAFNTPDVASVQTRQIRQLLLREGRFLPQFSDPLSEAFPNQLDRIFIHAGFGSHERDESTDFAYHPS
ncbi:hypothetical protein ABIF68_006153 [Bradyrhizobium japonicum]